MDPSTGEVLQVLRQPYSFVLRRLGAQPRTVAHFDSSGMNFSGDRSVPWRAVREVRWMLDRPLRGYEHLNPSTIWPSSYARTRARPRDDGTGPFAASGRPSCFSGRW